MTTPTTVVVAQSKPDLIGALRTTWRRSAEHTAEQLFRFLRLTVLATIPSVVDLLKGGKFDYITLLTFVAPFAEVAYRQMYPALGAAKVDSADGVTIVPAQVGAADTPPDASSPVPLPEHAAGEEVDLDDVPDDLPAS